MYKIRITSVVMAWNMARIGKGSNGLKYNIKILSYKVKVQSNNFEGKVT